ncbi:hypothetical protein [Nocardioides sp.]|uniref:hypothetical protein n=1 Tax=Nocardioides sp. TaxID=35761 RepID=UPI0035649468
MARYDKYDPISGGFRAPLAVALDGSNAGIPLGVGLDVNGRAVKGAGSTGVLGVLVIDAAKPAGEVVDVMTQGEIVEVEDLDAGTVVYADGTAGALGTDNTDVRVGHTVEASRLVVRLAP